MIEPSPPPSRDWAPRLRALSDADLSAVVEGRIRWGRTPEEDMMIWNLAVTEERDR